MLAGPGTGKTTTLVEAVVDRVQRRGLRLDEVLVLTFSRPAAQELRDRITARIGRTSAAPTSSTFHAFCYGLVRRFQPADLYAAPLRLLSAPEHDATLRELMLQPREGRPNPWPDALASALRTRGFVQELHAVLAKARELELDPQDLAATGESTGRPEWVAAAQFMHDYLDVLDSSSALDYTELVHRAVLLGGDEAVRRELRASYKAVFVDEYQDTDPAQLRLLQALAGDGRDLVVVGDPDQSIYGFRGADVGGILTFPAQFRHRNGRPADVVALRVTRRFGAHVLAASRSVAAGIGVRGGIRREVFEQFRTPLPSGDSPQGSVEVVTFSSAGYEAAAIADLARRAHLEDGVPWSQIAVLVRSGVAALPLLRRTLVAAGVPVKVASDEIPLRLEPAVAPLLTALRCAADPDALTPESARALLLGPLCDIDASRLRQFARQLREQQRRIFPERLPLPSDQLVREALADPDLIQEVPGSSAAGVRRLGGLLRSASAHLAAGAAAEDALWTLWNGTPWPRRLRSAVERGGAYARSADRDLDAVCALFDLAARAEQRRARAGAQVFLNEVEAQQLPGDARADHALRSDGVRLLTAHRAKGLEWQVVVVAGVQEGSWPDLRQRTSLLQAERLGDCETALPPTTATALLAEERRLFYVAVTRARSRVVVTAVASPEPEGEQPSRFLATLGVPTQHRAGSANRALSVPGLVGELRRVASDPTVSDGLREAAAARLARLSDASVAGEAVAPLADPTRWWGLRAPSHSEVPLRPADVPLRLTASTLSAIHECPLRWFLGRQAAGQATRSSALGFGSVVHVLAEHLSSGRSADADVLDRELDRVWDHLHFPAPWIARRERTAADDMLRRFARWHNAPRARTFVGAEVPFEISSTTAAGHEVVLTGKVDRLERDTRGRAVVVDFKTGRHAPSREQVEDDLQLGFYQLATSAGAFDRICGAAESGGAELVHLRSDIAGLPKVQAQSPQSPQGGPSVPEALTTAVRVLRHEELTATGNARCDRCEFAPQCPVGSRGGDLLE